MNIMVCYDGSEVAKEALELAKTHAKAFDGKVFLVRSIEGGADIPKRNFDVAENELNHTVKTLLNTDDIPSESHLLVRGLTPGEDLVRFANEHQIDEIIVGVRRRSKVGKLLFGSTAQYVILEASCPVVAIK
jgi:nucleotide-binding universal stress UspA family protein